MISNAWPNGIPSIGQTSQRTRLVTARDIELFTEISGDRNPLHYDVEAARASRFGLMHSLRCTCDRISLNPRQRKHGESDAG
jgi:hypothetical protein